MINNQQVEGLMSGSGNVLGPNGDRIGAVGTFYLDDETNEPAWVTVNTGLFGNNESFVPLSEATVEGVDVLVPYSKDEVKNAPQVESDGSISPEEEVMLYRYYGFSYDDGSSGQDSSGMGTSGTSGTGTGTGTSGTSGTGTSSGLTSDSGLGGTSHSGSDSGLSGSGHSGSDSGGLSDSGLSGTGSGSGTSGTRGANIDDAMTRSEERLDVGTQKRTVGKARLRKYVVTDTVTQQVPVSREEVRIEREPITEENIDAALSGPEITEGEYEVTLEAEEPVISKHTEPVERVRLEKETVTDSQRVSSDVRKERIESDVSDAESEGMTGSSGSGHSGHGSGGSGHESDGSGSSGSGRH